MDNTKIRIRIPKILYESLITEAKKKPAKKKVVKKTVKKKPVNKKLTKKPMTKSALSEIVDRTLLEVYKKLVKESLESKKN